MRLGRLGHDAMASTPKLGFDGKPGKPARTDEPTVRGPYLRPMSEHAPIKVPSLNAKASTMPHDWPVLVKAILDRMQWSSSVLAGNLDVSSATVRNWTLGRCVPSKTIDKKVVELYRKHVGELP